jgi:hypothetical protein
LGVRGLFACRAGGRHGDRSRVIHHSPARPYSDEARASSFLNIHLSFISLRLTSSPSICAPAPKAFGANRRVRSRRSITE